MSEKLKDKTLGFFLTEKMSLTKWDKAGILSREIAPYNILAKRFKKINLFTYDGKEELPYQKYLAPNIEIVYKKWRMKARDYRWLMPFLHWKKIRGGDFFKTNQLLRPRAGIYTKIEFDWLELGNKIYSPSYISFQVSRHGTSHL